MSSLKNPVKMKFKLLLILVFLVSIASNELFAQTITGDWYTPLRNKLFHLTISKDSVILRKSGFEIEMQDYGYVDMAFKVEKVVNHNYIVSGIKDSVLSFYLLNFQLEKGKYNLNIESLNNKFLTLAEAENSLSAFGQSPLNITLIDKSTIDKIRHQRDISTMTTNDFKGFALKVIEHDSITASFSKQKYKLSYLYGESAGRIILSESGFNSLVKGNVFDDMLKKFAEDPETKEIFLKMTGQ